MDSAPGAEEQPPFQYEVEDGLAGDNQSFLDMLLEDVEGLPAPGEQPPAPSADDGKLTADEEALASQLCATVAAGWRVARAASALRASPAV